VLSGVLIQVTHFDLRSSILSLSLSMCFSLSSLLPVLSSLRRTSGLVPVYIHAVIVFVALIYPGALFLYNSRCATRLRWAFSVIASPEHTPFVHVTAISSGRTTTVYYDAEVSSMCIKRTFRFTLGTSGAFGLSFGRTYRRYISGMYVLRSSCSSAG